MQFPPYILSLLCFLLSSHPQTGLLIPDFLHLGITDQLRRFDCEKCRVRCRKQDTVLLQFIHRYSEDFVRAEVDLPISSCLLSQVQNKCFFNTYTYYTLSKSCVQCRPKQFQGLIRNLHQTGVLDIHAAGEPAP